MQDENEDEDEGEDAVVLRLSRHRSRFNQRQLFINGAPKGGLDDFIHLGVVDKVPNDLALLYCSHTAQLQAYCSAAAGSVMGLCSG